MAIDTTTEQRFSADIVGKWLDGMQTALSDLLAEQEAPLMIGIKSGGVDVARHLHAALSLEEPLGELNISFYRDDFSQIGLHPVVGPSSVPVTVEARHIILVDDVLSTGRTVRAAMNEIFDFGRPARITLAVLVERSDHELPIRADVVGHAADVQPGDHVSLDVQRMEITIGQRQDT